MLLVPHTLVGLVIGKYLGDPYLVSVAALLSHFILDKVPHWDFFSNTTNNDGSRTSGWRLFAFVADFGLGLALGMFFILKALWLEGSLDGAQALFLGAFFANLPDALTAPYIFKMRVYDKYRVFKWVTSVQKRLQSSASFSVGISIQALVSAVCFYLLLN